jgi:hypothetical protein
MNYEKMIAGLRPGDSITIAHDGTITFHLTVQGNAARFARHHDAAARLAYRIVHDEWRPVPIPLDPVAPHEILGDDATVAASNRVVDFWLGTATPASRRPNLAKSTVIAFAAVCIDAHGFDADEFLEWARECVTPGTEPFHAFRVFRGGHLDGDLSGRGAAKRPSWEAFQRVMRMTYGPRLGL